jgi:hypothetical protein
MLTLGPTPAVDAPPTFEDPTAPMPFNRADAGPAKAAAPSVKAATPPLLRMLMNTPPRPQVWFDRLDMQASETILFSGQC